MIHRLRNTRVACGLVAAILVGCVQEDHPALDLDSGRAAFNNACAICHGFEGEGLPGLGSSLVDNQFVLSSTEAEFVELIRNGRPADDPNNVSGRDMPARGGNPGLTDGDLKNIAAFVRSCLLGNDRDSACPPG
jgi:mono/diheme cytochrome c family protein